jgi:hypothetical protein
VSAEDWDEPVPDFVEDLDGKTVRAGDRVAYAAADGDSAGLRVGTVTGLQWSKRNRYSGTRARPTLKMRVEVDRATGYRGTDNSSRLIEVGFRRFVKIGSAAPACQYCTRSDRHSHAAD